jgi:hypothetical protein
MKKWIVWSFSTVLIFQLNGSPALALMSLGADSKTQIKDVALSETAKIDETSGDLPRVTQGLRQKKVVFAWFSVYVAQVFTKAKPDFTSIKKLKTSLKNGLPLVVSMTFLRNVEIEKIVEGFHDVFKENKMDSSLPPYSDFLEAVKKTGSQLKDRQKLFFAFTSQADKWSFVGETNGKEFFSLKDQPADQVEPFLNMWFGKYSDSGLEQLQGYLLKP